MDKHKQEARAIIATINKTESYWTCSQNEGDQLNIDLAWIPIADALCKRDAEIEQLRIENAALSSPQPGREQNELFRLQAENQKLDDAQAEIRTLREFIYHHSFNDSYLSPEHGWVCFHCGVRFLSQGAARSHFGDTPNDVRELRKQLIKRDAEIDSLREQVTQLMADNQVMIQCQEDDKAEIERLKRVVRATWPLTCNIGHEQHTLGCRCDCKTCQERTEATNALGYIP